MSAILVSAFSVLLVMGCRVAGFLLGCLLLVGDGFGLIEIRMGYVGFAYGYCWESYE